MLTKFNTKMTCVEFHKAIQKMPDVLKRVSGSEKYKKKSNVDTDSQTNQCIVLDDCSSSEDED